MTKRTQLPYKEGDTTPKFKGPNIRELTASGCFAESLLEKNQGRAYTI